uniref:Uncharacterized protein n=1 Tax=Octactis speculum TaxID=3111310 RepID=A0A6U3YCL6_9STRA|mmetsp:Transcript_61412/g.84371  ORF Transcript_61412/g.84371 Transcript_61412/m.84371 type:complete len:111 (+) Transcript_61412:367-699(+)
MGGEWFHKNWMKTYLSYTAEAEDGTPVRHKKFTMDLEAKRTLALRDLDMNYGIYISQMIEGLLVPNPLERKSLGFIKDDFTNTIEDPLPRIGSSHSLVALQHVRKRSTIS